MASALEQPKKPAGGAFGRFLAENRPAFMKQCQGKPISEITKLAGAEWKSLSDAAKAPWQKKFEEAQKKYTADMEAFLAAGGVKQKGAAAQRAEKRKAKEDKVKAKDPNAPKKPVGGAYGCYLSAHRAEFQKECPGSVAGVAKLAGERWKALPAAQRKKYEDEYAKKAAAYEEAKKNYVPPAKPETEAADAVEPPAKKARTSTSEKKAPVARASAKGKAKAKPNPDTSEAVDIPSSVRTRAEKSNMIEQLTKLIGRSDVKNAGVDAGKALDALLEANGLLHPARRALLGA